MYNFDHINVTNAFNNIDIKEKHTQKVLWHFIRNLLFKEYNNNNIYLSNLKICVKNLIIAMKMLLRHITIV